MIAGEMTDRGLRFGDAMMTPRIDRNDARLNAADDLTINGARGRLRSAKKIVPARRFNDPVARATTGPSADLTTSAVPNSEAAARSAMNVPVVGNGLFLRVVRTVPAVVAHRDPLDPSVAAGAVRRIGLVDVDLPEVARRNAPNAGTSGNNACRDLPPQSFE
jgi:hypothetical protein